VPAQCVRRLVFARDDVIAEMALRVVTAFVAPPAVPFPMRDNRDDLMLFPLDPADLESSTGFVACSDMTTVLLVWIAQSWFTDGINAVSIADAFCDDNVHMTVPHGPTVVVHEFSTAPVSTSASSTATATAASAAAAAAGGVAVDAAAVDAAVAGAGAGVVVGSDDPSHGVPLAAPTAGAASRGGAAADGRGYSGVRSVRVDLAGAAVESSWRVFDRVVREHGVPHTSPQNRGLLWRIRKAQSWCTPSERRRMVRLQLYALTIMLAEAAAGALRVPVLRVLSLARVGVWLTSAWACALQRRATACRCGSTSSRCCTSTRCCWSKPSTSFSAATAHSSPVTPR
jgi:hypothetical protein